MFILLIFSAKVSGSHYNPMITLAFMFRSDFGKFAKPLGLAYILFQIVGGFLGGLLGYVFMQRAVSFGIEDSSDVGFGITSETLGSFFLAFIYLTQTETATKVSKDPVITTLIMSSAYLASMLMVSGP